MKIDTLRNISVVGSDEKLPPSWTKGINAKLAKKGDLRDCDNWRGITLLNTISTAGSKISNAP